VYTDGACSGNPGPGGWAWAELDGAWHSGFEPETTNQRMEVAAALAACEEISTPLHIISDSTYVVNCWRDKWWEGWIRRGWKNSAKKPVANQDLWEQLVPYFRDREDLTLEWVKGHSGDAGNDLADALAVGAVQRREGAAGDTPPTEEFLGDEDQPTGFKVDAASQKDRGDPGTKKADPRVPDGTLLVVSGLSSPALQRSKPAARKLGEIISSYSEMHSDFVLLTGLRTGAEQLGASEAMARGIRYVVILPYPDPAASWSATRRKNFDALCAAAESTVTLEKNRPADSDAMQESISRRDGWMRSAANLAVVVTDGIDKDAEAAFRRWEKALGDDVWRLEVSV